MSVVLFWLVEGGLISMISMFLISGDDYKEDIKLYLTIGLVWPLIWPIAWPLCLYMIIKGRNKKS